jgi:hypothetical protein
MNRRGRKPLREEHVAKLDGSQRAKQRMTVFLKTLRGEWTIPQACQELGLSESHFHAAREEWLQGSLALLEPKPVGRPRRCQSVDGTMHELQARVKGLEHQLTLAHLEREVSEVMSRPAAIKRGFAQS